MTLHEVLWFDFKWKHNTHKQVEASEVLWSKGLQCHVKDKYTSPDGFSHVICSKCSIPYSMLLDILDELEVNVGMHWTCIAGLEDFYGGKCKDVLLYRHNAEILEIARKPPRPLQGSLPLNGR